MLNTPSLKLPLMAFIGFVLTSLLFWPGMMTSDALTQLSQAQSGFFSNHNPVIMTGVWFILNKLIAGPGLMFLMHNSMLWLSMALFAKSFPKKGWVFYLVPLWPTVFAYNQLIWKDISFSYSFLVAVAILTYHAAYHLKPKFLTFLALVSLLFYGVGTKYQAIFCVPIISFWLMSLIRPEGNFKSHGVGAVIMTGLLFFSYEKLEQTLVSPQHQSNAWQMARLYDLAGISVRTDKAYFPDYILKEPTFSLQAIEQAYTPQNVDSLIYVHPPLLKTTQDPQELQEIKEVWKKAIYEQPLAYLQHRGRVWLKLINKKPDNFFYCLDHHSELLWLRDYVVPFENFYMSWFPSLFTRFYWMIVIALIALWRYKKLKLYERRTYSLFLYGPLLCLTQLMVYMFLSMASDLRYLYFSNCLGLVMGCLLLMKKSR